MMATTCAICGIRKARRACPGVHADICTVCCATGRETTINCPLSCEYLRDAHTHEKLPSVDPETFPNSDIKVTQEFLEENEGLLAYLGTALYEGARETPNTNDLDLREALEGLVRTYRTLESGLYYESRPQNPLAARVMEKLQLELQTLRDDEKEKGGVSTLRDSVVLGVLAFLQRLEYTENNGRPKSKSYLDTLRRLSMPSEDADSLERSDLEPDEPRIIL